MCDKVIFIILVFSIIGCNFPDGRIVKNGDTVFVAYRIKNIAGDRLDESCSGKNFDQLDDNELFSFVVGKGEVIKGWDSLIVGRKKNTVYLYKLTPENAYGSEQIYHDIPSNSNLILEYKIVDIR